MSRYYKLVEKTIVPCTLIEWSQSFENADARRVARDSINNLDVSTVFLGLNHSFSDDESPLLFETMVFDERKDRARESILCERCTTYEQAEAQHARILALAKTGNLPLDPP